MLRSLAHHLAFLLVAAWIAVAQIPAQAQPASPAPASCTAPEYHQLDFWIGDWDVYELNKTEIAARVRVEPVLDGCALHESYDNLHGMKGESLSTYDAVRKVWHQTWITNRGALLTIEGTLQGTSIIMAGTEPLAGGGTKQVRGAWTPIDQGVRETALTSVDGGKTWEPWFDLVFRTHH